VTLAEFVNELRRLHCIDGWYIPELSPERQQRFVDNPVQFLIRADDETQEAIWRAMERDREHWAKAQTGLVVNLMDALRRTIDQ
jgi:hypothetical protein